MINKQDIMFIYAHLGQNQSLEAKVLLHITDIVEPESVTEASKHSQEIKAQSLIPAPPNEKINGSKWVYKVKKKFDGMLKDSRLGWWLKGSTKFQDLTIERYFVLW